MEVIHFDSNISISKKQKKTRIDDLKECLLNSEVFVDLDIREHAEIKILKKCGAGMTGQIGASNDVCTDCQGKLPPTVSIDNPQE